MDGTLWVADLYISPHVITKINLKHRVTAAEITDVVKCQRWLPFHRHHHPEYGLRYLVQPTIRSTTWLVSLYPSPKQEDYFALGTAYPLS